MKKVILLSVLILCILIMNTEIFAVPTEYGTTVTNRATVSGANLPSSVSATNYTNVQRIVGVSWSGGIDKSASANSITNLYTYLTNVGNSTQRFIIGVFDTNYNAVVGTTPWVWTMYTQTLGGPLVVTQNNGNTNTTAYTTPVLQPADSLRIIFRVYIPNDITSGTAGWNLIARPVYSGQNNRRYQGDNQIYYGGATNIGFGQGGVLGRADLYSPVGNDYYYEITVSAPVIHISKTIVGIGMQSTVGPQGWAVPGASITNIIKVSNVGSGNALNIVVRDFWNNSWVSNGAMSIIANSEPGDVWAQRTNGTSHFVTWSNTDASGLGGSNQYVHFKFITTIR